MKKFISTLVARTLPCALPHPSTLLSTVAGSAALTMSFGAYADASENVPMQRVEAVTGSLIRASERTEYNQVQHVTAADIQESGASTVADFLRDISANSGSSYNESTVLNQSPGATGIALRGLSVKYTLVLIDGQRATPYAFASGGTDTFTDLNTLPLNIIDHIDIVKAGAVSQYGSDAIAGVVNIITKKNVHGTEVDGNIGGTQMGGQYTRSLSVLNGFGNLDTDRYNVTTALSYLDQSGISMSQRDLTSTQDYTDKKGGLFAQPSSFVMMPGGPQALPVCGPDAQITPGLNNLQALTAGTVCSQNGASAQSLAAQVMRSSAKVHADFRIGDYSQAFIDLMDSHNATTLAAGQAGFGANALVPSLYFVPGTGYTPFAPTLGGNPLSYYFPDSQVLHTTSNFYRISSGIKGSFTTEKYGDWDWATSYGHSQSDVSNAYSNQINASVVQNYLNGVTPATFSPTTLNALPGLFGTSSYHALSKLDTLDATISSGNVFKVPAGDVGLGFGAQFQHQSEFIGAGSFDFVNPITQRVEGQRNAAALYYQVDVPLLSNLSLSQAGRYDHYNDFGGVFSPRVALRYQPTKSFTMYGSYNAGFRAPTLIELDQKESVTYQVVGNQNVNEYFTGNPHLQAEKTKNYNLGFQFSPTKTTDIGLDWYKISVSNVISQPNVAAIVADNPGQPLYNLPYSNISFLNTDGFEATLKQVVPSSIGTFTLNSDWAYVWHFKIPNSIVPDFAGNNGANNTVFGGALPRWKGNTSLSLAKNNWATSLSWQFTGGYKQVINTASSDAPSYSLFNLSASYSGIKNWRLYANVNNLLNRAPPFDAVWMNTYRGYYDPSLYQYIGRSAQIGATYKF